MSNQILINYNEVYRKTAELRSQAINELRETTTAYRQIASSLRGMDSGTNFEIAEAMQSNQLKSQATVDTLTKLLSFIETSARQVERGEQTIAMSFRTVSVRNHRRGGVI